MSVVGYGSTLRNVGRADDAVGLLGDAVAADPDHPPYRAFLALALDTADLDGFERALGAYHDELLTER